MVCRSQVLLASLAISAALCYHWVGPSRAAVSEYASAHRPQSRGTSVLSAHAHPQPAASVGATPEITVMNNTAANDTKPYDVARAVMASNGVGHWMWRPDGEYVDEVLIVLGGAEADPTATLVQHGYKVWRRNLACNTTDCKDIDHKRWDLTLSLRERLREAAGYASYLADPDPKKPVAPLIAFLRSTTQPTGELIRSIQEAVRCAKLSSQYTPLHRNGHHLGKDDEEYGVIAATWNSLYPENPITGNLKNWAGSEFVVPLTLVERNTPEYYGRGLARFEMDSGAVANNRTLGHRFYAHTWHKLFGQQDEIDTELGIEKCDDAFDTSAGVMLPTVDREEHEPHSAVEWNGIGMWVWDPAVETKGLVVVGGDNNDPSLELVKRGYKVWRRTLSCRQYLNDIIGDSAMHGDLRHHMCTESWGYFGYLADASSTKPVYEFTAFIHGHYKAWHQPGNLADLIDEAIGCAAKTQAYTPLVQGNMMLNWEWRGAGVAKKWVKLWNRLYADVRNLENEELLAWGCSSFVLPSKVLQQHPTSLYRRMLRDKVTYAKDGVDGFFFEYTVHVLFGVAEVINRPAIAECPTILYRLDEGTRVIHD